MSKDILNENLDFVDFAENVNFVCPWGIVAMPDENGKPSIIVIIGKKKKKYLAMRFCDLEQDVDIYMKSQAYKDSVSTISKMRSVLFPLE